jgi:hypothetical protein
LLNVGSLSERQAFGSDGKHTVKKKRASTIAPSSHVVNDRNSRREP